MVPLVPCHLNGLSLICLFKFKFTLLQMDFEGLTGRIHFGKYGERSDFTLDITKLDKMGLKKVRLYLCSMCRMNQKSLKGD